MANKTTITARQNAGQFNICTAFQIALFGVETGQMIAGSERLVPKNAASNNETHTTAQIPPDYFEQDIPAGAYKIGIRGINDGGEGTYVLADESIDVVPEPLPLAEVQLS